MDYKKLTIGQMAELNRVSTQTLRYYDKFGILKPNLYNKDTGYRYYNMSQCAVLDTITHMKSLNMPLEQIKAYIDTGDYDSFISELTDKYTKIKEEIRRLENIEAVLKRKIDDYQKRSLLPPDGVPYIEVIHQRQIYKFDTHINYYYNGNSIEQYEHMLRLFKNHLLEKDLGIEYFYNVGSIMKKEDFINQNYVSTELFIFLQAQHTFKKYDIIKPNTYLCMTCENTDTETEYIQLMYDTIEKNYYQIAGDYICEVVNESFAFDSQKRNMTLKLQIPITFHQSGTAD
ncbi:MAG: MerR family transcriptional regulator [Dorea sp.]|jgi:DNA-binding transcriptional MerR regulator|nr:MerR family transcriptional regulator [Dorea sp.]